MKLITYLFPRRPLRSRLPLLSREWSSNHLRYGTIPDDVREAIRELKGHGIARTDQDAYRVLKKYEGEKLVEVIRREKRKRRPQGKFRRAWERLKRLW